MGQALPSGLSARADRLSSIRGWRRITLAATLGLSLGGVAAFCIAPSVFRAVAVVSVAEPSSAMRAAVARAGAGMVVSKPVMLRAAASLIGTGFVPPAPDPAERLALTTGVPGAKATGAEGRLAEAIADSVRATGSDAGTIEITVAQTDAETAARIASAVADGFVAEQDDAAAQGRRLREIAANNRIEALQVAMRAASRRFASFAGAEIDPVAARAGAAAKTAAAVERLDAIKAIIVSNAPPLSDARNLPAPLDKLQQAYLDQVGQLDKARETLGDRHTTVMSLRDGVRTAAANLTTEWKRIKAAAEVEVAQDRAREDVLRKADTPADATRQSQIIEARAALQRAQAALSQAQTQSASGVSAEDHPYRLVARASVPLAAAGLSDGLRLGASVLLGLLAFVSTLMATGRAPAASTPVAAAVPLPRREPARVPVAAVAPKAAPRVYFADDESFDDDEVAVERPLPRPVRAAPPPRPRTSVAEPFAVVPEPVRSPYDAILPRIAAIEPLYGPVPTIIVAANQASLDTTPAALALATAAAEQGHRVLLIEGARAYPELAAAADPDDDPVVLDVFGTLRVALRAADCKGHLYLAPAFVDGSRLASAVARSGEAAFVDEIDEAFDLIVIDGGRAADIAATGWGADAALRIGRSTSAQDDMRFVATLGCAPDALLGVVVGSVVLTPALSASEASPLPRVAPRASVQADRQRATPSMSVQPDTRRRANVRQRA
jgi:hypothetical protein